MMIFIIFVFRRYRTFRKGLCSKINSKEILHLLPNFFIRTTLLMELKISIIEGVLLVLIFIRNPINIYREQIKTV